MTEIIHDKDSNIYYFNCPHCELLIQVPKEEIRCTIFRHANFKKDMAFVPPHASKDECESWIKNDIVYGCAKPFRFTGRTLEICGYI
jgi:hypothetical protein